MLLFKAPSTVTTKLQDTLLPARSLAVILMMWKPGSSSVPLMTSLVKVTLDALLSVTSGSLQFTATGDSKGPEYILWL